MDNNKEEFAEKLPQEDEQKEHIPNEEASNDSNQKIEELVKENQELKDKLLRQIAETENVRVRNLKTLKEARDYAVTEFAKDMVIVMDNLSRALEHIPEEMDELVTNIVQGIKMTHNSLENTFKKHGIDIIAPKSGDKFDYTQHHAISQQQIEGSDPDLIVEVMQCGYQIKDRLLRPASVVVSK
ncbi:MAG: nucleotide exchange factor GrpE [Rickettsiaceae bacterium]|nr:nucleotide exchange factor GrpE [Rickettsiaceae bacterium]